ncbi:Scr1 family TA system antitoxin-like transcriptional regulator [Micromonospora chokoriensis]
MSSTPKTLAAEVGRGAFGTQCRAAGSCDDQPESPRRDGWWQRLGGKYATCITYFEPMLVPGLLQTESYARELIVIGRETDPDSSGFVLLSFEQDEPPRGYIETLAGELFLESSRDLARLSAAYDNLKMLAMSPAESVTFIRELSKHAT